MNAADTYELFLTGVSMAIGALIFCFRRHLTNYVLSVEDSDEISGWKKGVSPFFSLLGQLILIWGLVHALRQFGVDVEPAPQ
jgi:hypothetical protein